MTTYQSQSTRVRQLFSTLAAVTASNPVLLEGEKWNEKDATTGRATGRSKTGDGVVSADKTTITGTAFNDLPFDPGGSSTSLSDATPQALGTAAAGTASTGSRSDHRHAMPTANQVGADATGTAAAAVAAAAGNYATTAQGAKADTAVQPAGLSSYVQTSDSRLSDAREWSAATVTQATAEAGVSTTRVAYNPLRVFQSIAAWWTANTSALGRSLATAANAAAGRTALELGSAATTDASAYATAAQGTKADSAVQLAALASGLAGKADLVGGLVPSVQLPGFVDDVLEYANVAAFPATGESGKLYISLATNRQYRWSGSIYVEINPSPGSTDAVPEGSVNLYFTTARGEAAATSWWAASASKVKLDGIASGATANSSDATLLARANHTGTQAAGTITGLATVATSGAYADLSGRPTLGTAAAAASTAFAASGAVTGSGLTVTSSRVIGRSAAGTGAPEEISIGTGLSLSGGVLSVTGGGATNIWIPAAQWIPATTNGCGINSLETTTNKVNYDVLEFDSTTSEQADCIVTLPNNWSYGTVTAQFYWTAASSSGGVVFQLAGLAYGDNIAIDTAMGTAQSVADTLQTVNNMHVSAATAAITIAGTPAANKPVQFQIKRLPADASDTLLADARLIGVEVIF